MVGYFTSRRIMVEIGDVNVFEMIAKWASGRDHETLVRTISLDFGLAF